MIKRLASYLSILLLTACGTPDLYDSPGAFIMMDIGMSVEEVKQKLDNYDRTIPEIDEDDIRVQGVSYSYLRFNMLLQSAYSETDGMGFTEYYESVYTPFYLVFKDNELIWLGYPYEARSSDNPELIALGEAFAKIQIIR